MKAVMIDGPKSGEVITFSADEPGELINFAIAKKLDILMPFSYGEYDPYTPLWGTATYRRLGRVSGRGEVIDVYTFAGMTT